MKQGDILEVSGKVVFESNEERDYQTQAVKPGVVRRGFLCTDRAGKTVSCKAAFNASFPILDTLAK